MLSEVETLPNRPASMLTYPRGNPANESFRTESHPLRFLGHNLKLYHFPFSALEAV